jgi:hypothetical protein
MPRIVNRRGAANVDAWGRPAEWVDDHGPVNGKTAGIAVMSHPQSFVAVPRWHVRPYGLLAANQRSATLRLATIAKGLGPQRPTKRREALRDAARHRQVTGRAYLQDCRPTSIPMYRLETIRSTMGAPKVEYSAGQTCRTSPRRDSGVSSSCR